MGQTTVVSTTGAYSSLGLRPVNTLVDELLDYTGGADRPDTRARARRALVSTVNAFNAMAWRFNRKTLDVAFVTSTSEYPLHVLTRDVMKVTLLDSNGEQAGLPLEFTKYEDFLRYDASTLSTVTVPDEYTVFNQFDTGLIRFLPRIGTGTFTYPTARVFYHIRIAMPASDDLAITVPPEVETALVRHAAALLLARVRTYQEAAAAKNDANDMYSAILREWRDFPDFMQRMGG